jgi:signal transduction histidine kinase
MPIGGMTKQNEKRMQEELGKLRKERDELTAELQTLSREASRLRQELEEQTQSRRQFIVVLAHELRTPLTPVVSGADLLAEQFRPEPGSLEDMLIRSIIDGAESLGSTLSNLLDLAQFQAGVFTLKIAPIDITSLLRELALQFEPLAKSKRQSLTLELPQEMPLVKVDQRRIGQVVTNLLGNALKFTPEEGSIVLRAMARDPDLMVEVQDSGPGLRPEEQHRLFQPYFRSEVDRQRLSGAGLGLALSREIVEAHGGEIWLNSEVGKGSTFGFSIPVKETQRSPSALR